jgi:hypothetical protein
MIMTKRIVSFGGILAILALPLAAQAQPTSAPVGGGVAASKATRVAGTSESAGGLLLSTDQTAKVHEYVTKEKRPSVSTTEKLAVGTVLPSAVELYPLPASLGVKSEYRYSVVNEHTVLVEANTHKVTQIIN